MTSTTYTCKDNDRPLIEETAQGSHGSHSSHYFAGTYKQYREYLQNERECDEIFPI